MWNKSSNYVMNPFEACSVDLFGQRYRLRGWIVSRAYDFLVAASREFWGSVLAHAWLATGDGFSHHRPGDNNHSINARSTAVLKSNGTKDQRDGWIDIGAKRPMRPSYADIERMDAKVAKQKEEQAGLMSDSELKMFWEMQIKKLGAWPEDDLTAKLEKLIGDIDMELAVPLPDDFLIW